LVTAAEKKRKPKKTFVKREQTTKGGRGAPPVGIQPLVETQKGKQNEA